MPSNQDKKTFKEFVDTYFGSDPNKRAVFSLRDENDTLLGLAGFSSINEEEGKAFLKIIVLNPKKIQQEFRYIEEILPDILESAWETFNLKEIFIAINKQDAKRQKLYKKHGFSYDGSMESQGVLMDVYKKRVV